MDLFISNKISSRAIPLCKYTIILRLKHLREEKMPMAAFERTE